MRYRRPAGAVLVFSCVVGCADGALPPEVAGQVEVRVAPLSLPDIDFACFDVRVDNGSGTVWSRGAPGQALTAGDSATICSRDFGNGAGGDITYVGTCDAASDSDGVLANGVQNKVTVWVDGLYRDGAPPTDLGDWRDPCPNGCALNVDCNENEDTLALFDLTIMREANQGFFDVAVNFEDIFCSAKVDTCYDDTHRIELLHGADGERDWTAVFGFACTAGPTRPGATSGPDTNLMLSRIEVSCPGNTTFVIDPRQDEGNQSVTLGTTTLDYGIYRGVEDLDCGQGAGSCHKKYWNLAFSLKDLDDAFSGACTLKLSATANDAGAAASSFTAGLPTRTGQAYPYVSVDVDLLDAGGRPTCQQNALDAGGGVATEYGGNTVGAAPPVVMCHQFEGSAPTATGGAGCVDAPSTAGMVSFRLDVTSDAYCQMPRDSDSELTFLSNVSATATIAYRPPKTPGFYAMVPGDLSYDVIISVPGEAPIAASVSSVDFVAGPNYFNGYSRSTNAPLVSSTFELGSTGVLDTTHFPTTFSQFDTPYQNLYVTWRRGALDCTVAASGTLTAIATLP